MSEDEALECGVEEAAEVGFVADGGGDGIAGMGVGAEVVDFLEVEACLVEGAEPGHAVFGEDPDWVFLIGGEGGGGLDGSKDGVEVVGEGFAEIGDDVFLPVRGDGFICDEVSEAGGEIGLCAAGIAMDGAKDVPVIGVFGVDADAAVDGGGDFHSAFSTVVLSWWIWSCWA